MYIACVSYTQAVAVWRMYIVCVELISYMCICRLCGVNILYMCICRLCGVNILHVYM